MSAFNHQQSAVAGDAGFVTNHLLLLSFTTTLANWKV